MLWAVGAHDIMKDLVPHEARRTLDEILHSCPAYRAKGSDGAAVPDFVQTCWKTRVKQDRYIGF